MDLGRSVLIDMTGAQFYLFVLILILTIILYLWTIWNFIISRRLILNLSSGAEHRSRKVIIRSLTGILGLFSVTVLFGFLHLINLESFETIFWLNAVGILLMILIRISIEKHLSLSKKKVNEGAAQNEYVVKLKREESQILKVAIVSNLLGFLLLGIQYTFFTPQSSIYEIVSILIIPTVEALAIFSTLFWIIWHFSRRKEQNKTY